MGPGTIRGMSRVSRNTDRPITEHVDLEDVRDQVDSWYAVKRQTAMLTKKLNQGKETLKGLVQRYGETQPETGSLFLDLQAPVGDRKIATLKNQRSVTTTVNMEAAERILKRKKLWDEMTHTEVVLDQDKVFAAFFDNRLSKADVDRMFSESVHFSFILLDDDGKPVS